MKSRESSRNPFMFHFVVLSAVILPVLMSLNCVPVSADQGINPPPTKIPGRLSPYWEGRGIVIQEPGNTANHVMFLRQRTPDDDFSVYTLDPIPVLPGETYQVSYQSRALGPDNIIAGITIDVFENDLLIQRMYTYPEFGSQWLTVEFPFPMPLNATHIRVHLLSAAFEMEMPDEIGWPEYPTAAADPAPLMAERQRNTILFDNIQIHLQGQSGSIVPDWNFEKLITPER